MLFKKEHYELLNHFETQFKHHRLDKEKKDTWHAGIIYQDGRVNELFLAFRRGYAFGVYQSSDAAIELAAPSQEPAVPAEIDVRTILLAIVPGDGNGQEVYAKTVDDVVAKLTELSERLEAAESGLGRAAQEPVTLTDEEANAIKLTSWTDEENYGAKFCDGFNAGVNAIIAALREKEARK